MTGVQTCALPISVIAVARKLAVLLHVLWIRGEVYEPLRQRLVLAQAS